MSLSLATTFGSILRRDIGGPREASVGAGEFDTPASGDVARAALGIPDDRFYLVERRPKTVLRTVPQSGDVAGRLFESLVSLKVAVSQYAMHLSREQRHRIFGDLDSVLNTDDWHDGDDLPKQNSFRDFLKWMIFAGYSDWTSIGVSDDGNILVAWRKDGILLTANFNGRGEVRWTAKASTPEGVAHIAGSSTLQYFAKQAKFYLG